MGPPFTLFGTMRHFPKEKNIQKFQDFFQEKCLRCFSLRYSADFRRSRLVCDLKQEAVEFSMRMLDFITKNSVNKVVSEL